MGIVNLYGGQRKYLQWKFQGMHYRLCRLDSVVYDDHTDWPDMEYHNVIQARRCFLFPWKTLESEHVPAHVIISMACVGDSGGWRSRLFQVSVEKYGRPVPQIRSRHAHEPPRTW